MADNYDYGYGYDWGYDPTAYEGYGVDETGRSSSSQLTYDPTQIEGYGVNETGAVTGLEKYSNILQSLLGGKGLFDSAAANRLAQMGAFGGLGALLNRLGGGGGGSSAVGYQGGIPKYTITRAQTPVAQQRPAGYRPGQGGITYFAPIQYNKAGYDIGSAPVAAAPVETPVVTPTETISAATGGYMPGGGIAMYAGGRYLRGPGDGVSDSIPAKFEQSGRPARLADGEFVIDARTVSEIGNGSSEAGARKLYAMMDRVHKARKTAKRGKPSGADKYLPK